MAAEYEVNIKINSKQVVTDLNKIDTAINKVTKKAGDVTDRRTAAMVRLRNVGDAVRKLEEKGLDVSKARLQVTKASQAVDKGLFKTANERLRTANKEIKAQKRITKELERQQSLQMPQQNTGQRFGMGQRSSRLEQVALGAGFPLLFGGGPGSIIGGGLGGLTRSFGAQIAFSAAGQQIDKVIASTVSSAESLTSVGKALDFMRERSLFSSDKVEELAYKLEKQGDLAGIAALVTDELNDALGPEGIQKMQDLAEQTEIAKEQFGLLSTNLELLIAGPLAEFLKIVNQVLGISVAQSQFAKSFERLKSEDPQRLKTLLPSFEGARDPVKGILSSLFFGPNLAGGLFDMQGLSQEQLTDFTQQMNSILDSLGSRSGNIPITEEDRDRFKGDPPRKLTSAETGEGIARRLREQIAAYEELDPFARRMAVIEAERESIQERINKVLDGQKKKELTLQNNRLKDLKVSQEKQKIEDEIINLQLQKEDQVNAENEKLSNTIDNYHEQLKLLQAKIDGTEDQVALEIQLKKAGTDIEKNYINQVNVLKEQVQVVENLDRIYDQIGQSIASGVVDTLSAAVDQTQSLADAAANTLRNIANILLRLGTNTLLKGTGLPVFENLQGFANGGRPPVNRPSIVGERGPELFIPGAQGTIVPNHAMGGSNIVVNVDASGTQAQGDQPNAKALGAAIGAAVQAELIKQKRPGGLLA